MGLIVKRTHRVIAFKQATWLAPYINFNTQKRQEATTDFEKNLYKLANNAVFGKMCEDLRKRADVRIVTQQIEAERCAAKPNFDSFRIINDDVSMVKMKKTSIMWRKPTYVGFTILELSKLHMYKFHYEYMMDTYDGSNEKGTAKLLFTDTDSLCYEIQTKDVYADMKKHSQHFDTSDYPTTHPNYSRDNAKVVGKLKDECASVPPQEFVGLRSKMYSLLLGDDKQKSTAKGIQRSAQKKIRHEAYRECLFDEKTTTETFHNLQSKNHIIRTEKITKSALSCYDDKRYLLCGTTDTLAYGHWRIKHM
jgi:hypothetical protein